MTGEPTVAVGRILKAHGVQGEVAVAVLTEVEGRFAPGSVLLLEDGRSMTVRSSRPRDGGLLVRFEEIRDREHARAFHGLVLSVPASSSPPLPEGSWWDHEIVGCAVSTTEGRDLGTVDDVLHGPANDVWSVMGERDPMLIPALPEFIVSVDVPARRVVVREVPGITTDTGDDDAAR